MTLSIDHGDVKDVGVIDYYLVLFWTDLNRLIPSEFACQLLTR